jgi:hypothetical protein
MHSQVHSIIHLGQKPSLRKTGKIMVLKTFSSLGFYKDDRKMEGSELEKHAILTLEYHSMTYTMFAAL